MNDFFERWAVASRSRPDPGTVPACCWRRLEIALGRAIRQVTALRGGQSGSLAARVVTSDGSVAVKGVDLAVASARDIERLTVEATILRAASGVQGVAQWEGESSCHWLMMATRWIEGEHLTAAHSPEILERCLQTIHRIGELIRSEDIPAIEWSVRRRYSDSLEIRDLLDLNDTGVARAVLLRKPKNIGLIHGGLWPDNILVCDDCPVLLDWGSAGLADPAWDQASADLLRGQLSARRPAPPGGRGHLILRSISAAMVLEADTERRAEVVKALLEASGG